MDGSQVVFVARKAIGYFFMEPVTAASIVISLMRHTLDEQVLALSIRVSLTSIQKPAIRTKENDSV